MSAVWARTLSDPQEAEGFHSLLDEYFARGITTPARRPTPAAPTSNFFRAPLPIPTPVPHTSFSDRANAFASSSADRAGPTLANAALKNTTATSAALRNAGLSPGAAAAASKFGSKHSTVLAPHLATAATGAAKEGWANRAGIAAGATGKTPPPTAPKVKGPQPPSGLSSSKTIAGGFSVASGKDFGKSLWSSKGPMSNEEAKKQVFREPLAVGGPAKSSFATPPPPGPVPPPIRRGAALAQEEEREEGLGRAKALYDYDGADADDLPLREGEAVVVVEHVSEEWWRCRSNFGKEGLVPVSYLEMVN